MSSWEFYDQLIEGVPGDATVQMACIAPIWTVARSDFGTGMAMTPLVSYEAYPARGTIRGSGLARTADLVKSWNFHEAAVGLAALNSYYNRMELLQPSDRLVVRPRGRRRGVFGGFDELVRGKRVAVVGHASHVERLGDICELTFLERVPWKGDLPDPACEYVLAEQDYVFITASTIQNKTLPRLLELARPCCTVVWGPSAPVCDALIAWGADAVLGNVVVDGPRVTQAACEGCIAADFSDGLQSVCLFRDAELALKVKQAEGFE